MSAVDLGMIGGTGPDFIRMHCRSTDPTTSQNAARHAQTFASGHCKLILDSLRLTGPQCSKEIGAAIGLKSEQVSRRTKDMRLAGLIRIADLAQRDGCDVLEAVQ